VEGPGGRSRVGEGDVIELDATARGGALTIHRLHGSLMEASVSSTTLVDAVGGDQGARGHDEDMVIIRTTDRCMGVLDEGHLCPNLELAEVDELRAVPDDGERGPGS